MAVSVRLPPRGAARDISSTWPVGMTSLLTSRLSTVKTDFPTGNGLVTYRPDGAFLIDRDLRDSTGGHWYWHIRVWPTGGEPVQVRMARAGLLGRYGPAVSCGSAYEWLRPTPRVADSFSLAAPLGVTTLNL